MLRPDEDGELPVWGLGITNLVSRATAAASELSAKELRRGKVTLEAKVVRYSPAWTAFVGIGAYGTAFGRRKVLLGLQKGESRFAYLAAAQYQWSHAHYTPARFAELLRELREAACKDDLPVRGFLTREAIDRSSACWTTDDPFVRLAASKTPCKGSAVPRDCGWCSPCSVP